MQFKVTFKNGAEPKWVLRTSLSQDLIDEWQDVVYSGSGSDEEDGDIGSQAQGPVAQAQALIAQAVMALNQSQMTQNQTHSTVDVLAKVQSLLAQDNQAQAQAQYNFVSSFSVNTIF
ncbi:hypothetical protein CAEBREN_12301 [Caenorhabditis brenneri]|uniref:Uncharacterized protein n=1 Tax=Caenorhabditis brenneri TaxID=135651 RepID=G0P0C9_CAEBE|nr:hypothetical protein CAEBREN_12301 [Caenorhabditis brenneri]